MDSSREKVIRTGRPVSSASLATWPEVWYIRSSLPPKAPPTGGWITRTDSGARPSVWTMLPRFKKGLWQLAYTVTPFPSGEGTARAPSVSR